MPEVVTEAEQFTAAGHVPRHYRSFQDALGRKWLTASSANWWLVLALAVGVLAGIYVGFGLVPH